MFKGMAINKLKSIIKEKMIDGKLILTEDKLIDLINEYSDNEFNIQLSFKGGDIPENYYDIELIFEEK